MLNTRSQEATSRFREGGGREGGVGADVSSRWRRHGVRVRVSPSLADGCRLVSRWQGCVRRGWAGRREAQATGCVRTPRKQRKLHRHFASMNLSFFFTMEWAALQCLFVLRLFGFLRHFAAVLGLEFWFHRENEWNWPDFKLPKCDKNNSTSIFFSPHNSKIRTTHLKDKYPNGQCNPTCQVWEIFFP